MSGGHKWTSGQRAKFIATMRQRREAKVAKPGTFAAVLREARASSPVNDKSQPEQIVYHGALYRRVRSIKVLK